MNKTASFRAQYYVGLLFIECYQNSEMKNGYEVATEKMKQKYKI
jgi:hypothetical protein